LDISSKEIIKVASGIRFKIGKKINMVYTIQRVLKALLSLSIKAIRKFWPKLL